MKLENSRSENVREPVLPNPAKLILELTDALRLTANYDFHGLLQVSLRKFRNFSKIFFAAINVKKWQLLEN